MTVELSFGSESDSRQGQSQGVTPTKQSVKFDPNQPTILEAFQTTPKKTTPPHKEEAAGKTDHISNDDHDSEEDIGPKGSAAKKGNKSEEY